MTAILCDIGICLIKKRMLQPSTEDFETILKPKLLNLFFYTDMGMRKNLPGRFVTIKKDLVSGTIIKSGLIDFLYRLQI